MTTDVTWCQKLIDKHATDMLNYINYLPLSDYEKGMLAIKAKELLLAVTSDVMHETKDMCVDIFRDKLTEAKNHD